MHHAQLEAANNPQPAVDPTPDPLDCAAEPPPYPLRHGFLVEVSHNVRGDVRHLSDHSISIENFNYDGEGLPEVVIWLHRDRTLGGERLGYRISPDLRGREYVNETLVFPMPPEITGEMFGYVSIWCTSFPLNYAYARLFPGGFPGD